MSTLIEKRTEEKDVQVVKLEKKVVEVFVYEDEEYEKVEDVQRAVIEDIHETLSRVIEAARRKYRLTIHQAIHTLKREIYSSDGTKWVWFRPDATHHKVTDEDLVNHEDVVKLAELVTKYREAWVTNK
tara:strand:+ start:138 stop:521 length:384 start_codon:yes stop_codon:yes gene_type:complete